MSASVRYLRVGVALLAGLALQAAAPAAADALVFQGTFSNSSSLKVADGSPNPSPPPDYLHGTATQYPTTINVSGVGGTPDVHGITVKLHGLHHANVDDFDIMLQGPNGHSVMLLSDSGGDDAFSGDIFIDDSGPSAPDGKGLQDGSDYSPTNNFGGLGEEAGEHLPAQHRLTRPTQRLVRRSATRVRMGRGSCSLPTIVATT